MRCAVYKKNRYILKELHHDLAHPEKLSLNFSNSSSMICVNVLHPSPLFRADLLLSPWYFFCLSKLQFSGFFEFKATLNLTKITQNIVSELLQQRQSSGENHARILQFS